jgi:CheY-like chemotaxis protein
LATIVACEDDPTIRRLIQVALRSTQHQVHLAGDGAEGWELASSLQPDLVLTDFLMPNVDGLELIKRIRSDVRLAHIPIVLLSAASAGQAIPDGVCLLPKPFSPVDLRTTVEATLAGQAKPAAAAQHRAIDAAVLGDLRALDTPETPDPATFLIDLFLDLTPARLAEIQAALGVGDVARACKLAHTVKGSAGVVGATEVWQRAEALEAQAGDFLLLFAELEAAYARTRIALLSERTGSRDCSA